jgi:hypothetical protein
MGANGIHGRRLLDNAGAHGKPSDRADDRALFGSRVADPGAPKRVKEVRAFDKGLKFDDADFVSNTITCGPTGLRIGVPFSMLYWSSLGGLQYERATDCSI